MHPQLSIYQAYIISIILVRTLGVRLFSSISMNKRYARLWYLCRGIDLQGRGVVQLPMTAVCQLMGISSSTLYGWLREGKQVGAFRRYSRRGNTLHIFLGGLEKLCGKLGLRSWGTVAVVPLIDILNYKLLKQHATSASTQNLQEQSRYVAKLRLKHRERRCFRIPEASDILNVPEQSFEQLVRGQVQGIVHVGAHKIFVNERFIPIGGSQQRIAAELAISDRTVRRHLAAAGVRRKQILQTKDAYHRIRLSLDYENDSYFDESGIFYTSDPNGEIELFEPNGISSSSRPGGHRMSADRFFHFMGHVWCYRCNLYDLDYRLTSMASRRRSYKILMRQVEQNSASVNQENL